MPIPTRMVETWFLGPTNTLPARVRAKLLGSGRRFTIAWDHALGTLENHERLARLAMRDEPGSDRWPGLLLSSSVDGGGYVFAKLDSDQLSSALTGAQMISALTEGKPR